MCLLTSRLSIPIKGARVLAVGARGRILRGLRPADRTERLQPVAEGTPFQADASVTAQLNIIHMLDEQRNRQYGFKLSSEVGVRDRAVLLDLILTNRSII